MKRQKLEQYRPQSAKPGYRTHHKNNETEWMESQLPKHRKQIKIMRPDLTTNDFGRILPRKIYQDKQRLYSQTLQLKTRLNEAAEQNIRLKTRITILQKQKDKFNKGQSRNKYNKKPEQQSIMIRNLKKMIRQNKEQNEYIKQQNIKIKKAIKYTKINQLEIQRKMLMDENKKLNRYLEDNQQRLQNQQYIEKQVIELKKQLSQINTHKQQLLNENKNYQEHIENIQQQIKIELQKHKIKQNKMIRQINLNKKKLTQSIRQADDLRRELKFVKQQSNKLKKQIKFIKDNNNNLKLSNLKNRPMSSNPYTRNTNKEQYNYAIQPPNQTNQLNNKPNPQTQQVKIRTQQAQMEYEAKQQSQKSNHQKQNRQQNQGNKQVEEQDSKRLNLRGVQKQQQDYENEQFEIENDRKQIEQYRKQFEQDNNEQQIYNKKQQIKNKKQYKVNKKIMKEIKQLLTYRMKAQRYPFKELQKDIQNAQQKQFQYNDLFLMLNNQPFYLNKQYIKQFLSYCYQSYKIKQNKKLTTKKLIKKLRKVIDQFVLISQQQQQQTLYRIAQMTTAYSDDLHIAFNKIRNGINTVSKNNLIEMFRKLQLADNYIEIIIAQLSLCSQNLDYLNYQGYFKRFNLQEIQTAIDQEQHQDSQEANSKPLKIPNNDAEIVSDD